MQSNVSMSIFVIECDEEPNNNWNAAIAGKFILMFVPLLADVRAYTKVVRRKAWCAWGAWNGRPSGTFPRDRCVEIN